MDFCKTTKITVVSSISVIMLVCIILSCGKNKANQSTPPFVNGVSIVCQSDILGLAKQRVGEVLAANCEVISNRLKNYGIDNAGVYKLGTDRIIIQLPQREDV